MPEICGYQISDACYYACPFYKFGKRQIELDRAATDIESAVAANLSIGALAAVKQTSADIVTTVQSYVADAPADGQGPWRAQASEGYRRISELVCCSHVGMAVIGEELTLVHKPTVD